tara:strand:+ start:930 stop:1775 length:846 start_codon:yes stop_codon:yes gene_type:complete
MNTTTRPNRNSYGTITLSSKQISNTLESLRPQHPKWTAIIFIFLGIINFYLVWHYIPVWKIVNYFVTEASKIMETFPKGLMVFIQIVIAIPALLLCIFTATCVFLLHFYPTFLLWEWYDLGIRERWISKEKKNRIAFWKTELLAAHNFEEDTKNYIQMETEQGHSYWLLSKGVDLETKLQAMLNRLGGKMKMTSTTGDGGVDLHGIFRGREVQIQCKGLAKNCGVGTIRDAAGVKSQSKQHMIVCCPIGFTKNSVIFASNSDIELWNADDLTRLAGTPDYD